MAKRKEDPPPAGCPAWQGTFADLMNLLLCFFVLLFSMSNMDAEKFEALAASFSNTFSIFSGGGSSFEDGMLISNGMSQLNELDEFITNTGAASDSDSRRTQKKAWRKPCSCLNRFRAGRMQTGNISAAERSSDG